jgi:hypothetical protein
MAGPYAISDFVGELSPPKRCSAQVLHLYWSNRPILPFRFKSVEISPIRPDNIDDSSLL